MRLRGQATFLVAIGVLVAAGLVPSTAVAIPQDGGSLSAQLAPIDVWAYQATAHSMRLHIRPPWHPHARGYKVYAIPGDKLETLPSPAPAKPPSRRPDARYRGSTLHDVDLTVHGLKHFKDYTFAVYGYDGHGHHAGTETDGTVIDRGFHLSGGRLFVKHTSDGSVVQDRRGGDHVVVMDEGAEQAQQQRIAYLTRAPGAKQWIRHEDPREINVDWGALSVSSQLSTDGVSVDTLVATCNGIDTSQTPVRATHLLGPTPFREPIQCSDYDHILDFGGWVQVPGGNAVIATFDAADKAQVWSGAPGGTFSPTKLPDPDAARPVAMTRDPTTGEITIVGLSDSGAVMWSRQHGLGWTDPTPLPTTKLHLVRASAAVHAGRIYVALETYAGIYVTTRSTSGRWSPLALLPHTATADSGPMLVNDTGAEHLQIAWTRARRHCSRCSGIYRQALIKRQWTQPHRISAYAGDTASAIIGTKSGHPTVGFWRY
jgi:hypothetical protein